MTAIGNYVKGHAQIKDNKETPIVQNHCADLVRRLIEELYLLPPNESFVVGHAYRTRSVLSFARWSEQENDTPEHMQLPAKSILLFLGYEQDFYILGGKRVYTSLVRHKFMFGDKVIHFTHLFKKNAIRSELPSHIYMTTNIILDRLNIVRLGESNIEIDKAILRVMRNNMFHDVLEKKQKA